MVEILYDVYISSSPKDKKDVDLLIDLLRTEIPQIQIWYEQDVIEDNKERKTRTLKVLEQTNTVIFVGSEDSCKEELFETNRCEDDIVFARVQGKSVIPFLLPGVKLKGMFAREFNGKQCVHAESPKEVAQMISDLKRWTVKGNMSRNQSQKRTESETSISQLSFNPQTGEFQPSNHQDTVGESSTDIQEGYINGHEYVDLGLPSGVKWATCHIGATDPDGYGDCFAWGEIEPKKVYSEANSQTYRKDNKSLEKSGYLDDKGNLTLSHDAARHNWGATWRLPTKEEIKDLIDHTTREFVMHTGVRGFWFKSKTNSNRIFIPMSGHFYDFYRYLDGSFGGFWSCSSAPSSDSDAYFLDMTKHSLMRGEMRRWCGLAVRPVSD